MVFSFLLSGERQVKLDLTCAIQCANALSNPRHAPYEINMEWSEFFYEQFASPGKLVGHLSYVLLVSSMLMRSMKWLRVIAIAAGVVSAIYGYFWLKDFVTVFWKIIFVTTNLVQLLILEWENRRAKFSEDEMRFVKAALPGVEKAHARRLLRLAQRKEFEVGKELTREGKNVEHLLFVLAGAVKIEKSGVIVGVCGHDDFIGEIGFMMGKPATATATVSNSVRCLCFNRAPLAAMLKKDMQLRHAMESSFNRNLVEKLIKSNEATDMVIELAKK